MQSMHTLDILFSMHLVETETKNYISFYFEMEILSQLKAKAKFHTRCN